MECQKIIIDCDAGSDDALAIAMLIAAHKQNKVEILAITCVDGNTNVDNVVNNVFRTLHVCDATDIPVYKGANSALLSFDNVKVAKQHVFHGSDGFGDVFYKDKPNISKLKEEHAVYALHKITTKYPDTVTILCLGPLTNMALAIKMYPDFSKFVKKFIIMGGNSSGVGNVTSQAEFNFFSDPESVHIVIHNAPKKLWLLTWETTLKAKISQEWRDNVFGKIDTPIINFINEIENGIYKTKEEFYIPCDVFVAGVLLRPDIAKDIVMHHIDIELHGSKTRGQLIIDHMKFNEPNAYIIQDIDIEIFKNLLLFTANPNTETSSILL